MTQFNTKEQAALLLPLWIRNMVTVQIWLDYQPFTSLIYHSIIILFLDISEIQVKYNWNTRGGGGADSLLTTNYDNTAFPHVTRNFITSITATIIKHKINQDICTCTSNIYVQCWQDRNYRVGTIEYEWFTNLHLILMRSGGKCTHLYRFIQWASYKNFPPKKLYDNCFTHSQWK